MPHHRRPAGSQCIVCCLLVNLRSYSSNSTGAPTLHPMPSTLRTLRGNSHTPPASDKNNPAGPRGMMTPTRAVGEECCMCMHVRRTASLRGTLTEI